MFFFWKNITTPEVQHNSPWKMTFPNGKYSNLPTISFSGGLSDSIPPPPPKDNTSLEPVRRKASIPSWTQLASPSKPGNQHKKKSGRQWTAWRKYMHIIYIIYIYKGIIYIYIRIYVWNSWGWQGYQHVLSMNHLSTYLSKFNCCLPTHPAAPDAVHQDILQL